MSEYADLALDLIEIANLTPARYRTARRLLDIARHTPNGQIRLQKNTVTGLCGTGEFDTARTHLIDLQDAGILHYSINETVHISLLAWPSWDDNLQKRAQEGQKRAQEGQKRAQEEPLTATQPAADLATTYESARGNDESARGNDESARGNDESARQYTHASAQVGWLVGYNNLNPDLQDTNQPTPLPPTAPNNDPSTKRGNTPGETERAMSWALLTKIGMLPRFAKQWSQQQPFGRVRDAVAHWHANRRSQGGEFDEEPKILNRWFGAWDEYLIPPLPPRHVTDDSPLWSLRELLFTPAELRAEAERIEREQQEWQEAQAHRGGYVFEEFAPAKTPPIRSSPFGPDGNVDPAAAWALLLRELQLQLPTATYDAWVRDTWAVGWSDGVLTVGLRHEKSLDWLKNRLSHKIERALGSMLRGSVRVEFVVIPEEASP